MLFDKARRFFEVEGADPTKSLVLISCGFDACEHEYPGMQRHGKSVPVGFYHQFASDAATLAKSHADGKLISFMEGGYADRAITSGAYAHTLGLANPSRSSLLDVELQRLWDLHHLLSLERTIKKGAVTVDRTQKVAKSKKAHQSAVSEATVKEQAWLGTVLDIFRSWTSNISGQQPVPTPTAPSTSAAKPVMVTPSTRVLRGRRSVAPTPRTEQPSRPTVPVGQPLPTELPVPPVPPTVVAQASPSNPWQPTAPERQDQPIVAVQPTPTARPRTSFAAVQEDQLPRAFTPPRVPSSRFPTPQPEPLVTAPPPTEQSLAAARETPEPEAALLRSMGRMSLHVLLNQDR